jgi:hypothetical protein
MHPVKCYRVAIFTIYSVLRELTGRKTYVSKSFLPVLFHELTGGNHIKETGESHMKHH